jgi:hypothetical protein
MNTPQRHKDNILRILSALSALVLLAGLLALWGCGEDKPTQPTEPKNYYVYFASEISEYQYFRYHTGTGVIDSFPPPYSIFESGFGISADGKTMYIHPVGEGKIIEMSLDSHVVVAEHQITIKEHSSPAWHQKVIVSPDSRYLVILYHYLHIYDMSDFSLIYRDTINVSSNGIFSQNGDIFSCAGHDTTYSHTYVLKIDLADGCTETKWSFVGGCPYRVIPDANYQKLFLYLHVYNELFLFQVYDITSDSIIFSKSLCPGAGDMEITPDGRYVIFSQPGTWIVGVCPSPRYFTIFDIEGNCIDREVDAFVDSLGIVGATNDLCLTPDGRHLIGIGLQLNGLFDYDMQRHEFNRHVVTGGIRYMFSLTCQTKR